jgi:hypothetical protein
LAFSLACESQKSPSTSPLAPLDLTAIAVALAQLPESERRARLEAAADALRGLPLVERVAFAARLLDRAGV